MRNWIDLLEGAREARFIQIDHDDGGVEGYVVETAAEQLEYWLSNRHSLYLPNFTTDMRSRYKTIAFLNNINVGEDSRGQGLGNSLMSDFIEEAAQYGAEAILLVADLGEEQSEGFDLLSWYRGWGFEVIVSSSRDPLMLMEMDS